MKRFSAFFPLMALLTLALAGVSLLYLATPFGPGLINDSIAYIAGARALLQGQGYSEIWLASELEPITHYPPLFSLSLAGLGALGLEPLRAARWLNLTLLGVNGLLLALLVWRSSRRPWLAVLAGSLYLLNQNLFGVHSYAITEPLFLSACLLAFGALSELLASGRRRWALLLGVTVGLSILTRYVGLALFAAVGLALWLQVRPWRERLTLVILYGLASLPLPLAWLARNELTAHVATNRVAAAYGFPWQNLPLGLENLSRFVLPFPFLWKNLAGYEPILAGLIGLGLMALLFWLWRRGPAASPLQRISLAGGLFALVYLAMLLVSMSFFDPATRFLQRILSPLYLGLLLCALAPLEAAWNWRPARGWLRLGLAFLQLTALVLLVQTAFELRQDGQGYASVRWSQSGAAQFLRSLPADAAIYTNSPPAVYATTERASFIYFLNDTPAEERAAIMQQVRQGRAGLVLWGLPAEETDSPDLLAFREALGLAVKSGRDWVFFGAR